MTEAVDPKHGPRPPVEFRLMYSAKNHSGETLMGDGMVTNLSHHGLGSINNYANQMEAHTRLSRDTT